MKTRVRQIAVVTVGRSDYGLMRPVLRRITSEPGLELQLIVSGAHHAEKFGRTVSEIEDDGFPVAAHLPLTSTQDSPESVSRAIGDAVIQSGATLAKTQPDLLLLLGDRYEMHAAALAALPLRIPVAHIHGGELTFGAIDDALRHSLTKLAHLHFPATEEYAARIRQMGEEPWRISVSGAPGLDNLADFPPADPDHFSQWRDLGIKAPPLLVTFHPVTLEHDRTAEHIAELLAALAEFKQPILFTLPNADAGHETIIRAIEEFKAVRPETHVVANLGTREYFGAMSAAAAMVGNSSSGIIEAASFKLPVVNIGNRQAGRTHGANVLDCAADRASITAAIRQAVDPAFRARLADLQNPYGDGHAAERIVARLREVELGERLLVKRFVDLPR